MQWSLPLSALYLNNNYKECLKSVKHFQVPSFKQDILGQNYGYAIEKGYNPQQTGGYWIDTDLAYKDGYFSWEVNSREM